MTTLRDVIIHNPTSSQGAAVLLRDGLFDSDMVSNFSPTHSSVDVLKTLSKAVLPEASKDLRAMNWFGSYGSGKSHLATLVGQLLRDGSHNDAFTDFLNKLENFEGKDLAKTIKDSFSPDSKPYLLVPLYGSQSPSLAAKMMEGLFKSIEQLCELQPELDIKEILPTTEYDVAITRLEQILNSDPEYKTKTLATWQLDQNFYDIDELEECLKRHEPLALSTFCSWHKVVCHGAVFQPQNDGGHGFIETYKEAAFNLKKMGFSGITVIWDEFGNALEDLLRTSERNPVDEIIQLQEFVETVCEPSRGHVIFIGLTHVSMGEYGARSSTGQDIQDRLKTIEGRFTPIKIELKASESEGYHLLSVQTRWTDKGKRLLDDADLRLTQLRSVWETLPLFSALSTEIEFIAKACYPLHPITAAGLFSISTQYAQATRTAFTFFRDLDSDIWEMEIDNMGLFKSELVRIPILIDYYEDSLRKNASGEFEKYRRAVAEVCAKGGDNSEYIDILTIIFLSVLLGDKFQSTDIFLAIALKDCLPENSSELLENLAWLQQAGLVWKNEMTDVWTLAGESGVEIEPLIEEKIQDISENIPEVLFANHEELRQGLLPILGKHNLAPSEQGIIRSYRVNVVTAPFDLNRYRLTDTSSAARVVLVLTSDSQIINKLIEECQSTPPKNHIPIYYWISELQPDQLTGKCKRYLSLLSLLKETSHGEGVKRQLKAKLDRSRHELVSLINDNFGRKGLAVGRTKIILSGQADPVNCHSWHSFTKTMSKHVSSLYTEEVAVRSQ